MRITRGLCILCLFLLSVAAAAAGDAAKAVDTKADEILRKMGRSLQAAKSFSFEVNDSSDEIMANGQKVQFGKSTKVLVRRPNALVADMSGDLVDIEYVYSGTKLAVFNRSENCYALQDVPDNLDAMFDFMAQ